MYYDYLNTQSLEYIVSNFPARLSKHTLSTKSPSLLNEFSCTSYAVRVLCKQVYFPRKFRSGLKLVCLSVCLSLLPFLQLLLQYELDSLEAVYYTDWLPCEHIHNLRYFGCGNCLFVRLSVYSYLQHSNSSYNSWWIQLKLCLLL